MSVYIFRAKTIDGEEICLDKYKGKVLIIANTASKCGFTPQYEALEELYKKYRNNGLEILAFPSNQFAGQEPSENSEIRSFCELNYGVSFQMFAKIDVRGDNADPLFKYLTEQAPFKGFEIKNPMSKTFADNLQKNFPTFLKDNSIKWNFTKFLIDRQGNVVKRFEPNIDPKDMTEDIEKLIYNETLVYK